ncbi:hypothetical protein [Gracilinema caldarium]|uniref:hypothetical protein n=1 Tax=Gracilinema caldarium TaxID=215591 RepID=UPI0026EE73E3|nr:hypothetical protein [Gracilinema caldarium]
MNKFGLLSIAVLVLLMVSCAPKSAESEKPAATTAETTAINVDAINDVASWKAAYDSVVNTYGTLTSRINNGDQTASAQAEELKKTAEALNAAAERIKANLSGQELTDFTAAVTSYQEKMTSAAAN